MRPTKREEELARRWNEHLSSELVTRRKRCALFGVLFLGLALALGVAGLEVWSIVAAAAGAIAWLQFFDANGQLDEVRRRSDKILVPDFSVLNEPASDSQQQRPAAPRRKRTE